MTDIMNNEVTNDSLDMCDVEATATKAAPKSMRVSSETMAALNEMKYQMGAHSLEEALKKLLTAFSMEGVQSAVPGRSTEIADFEAHVKALISLFRASLSTCESAEARIREEFRAELASKEDTIKQLSEQLVRKDEEVAALKDALDNLTSAKNTLTIERDAAVDRARTLEQSKAVNAKLMALLDALQAKMSSGRAFAEGLSDPGKM